MNAKKIFLLILILIVVLGGLFAFFYLKGDLPLGQNNATEENPFPLSDNPNFGSFQGSEGGETSGGEGSEGGETSGGEQIIPILRRLSTEPTSGVFTYNTIREVEEVVYDEEGNETIEIIEVPETKFQIVERKNGHISEFNSLDLSSIKLSNTSVTRVREVLAGDGGYLMQYVAEFKDSVVSFLAQIKTTSVERVVDVDEEGNETIEEDEITKLEGSFLPEGVFSATLSSDRKSVAYLAPSGDGSILYTTPITSASPAALASLPLTELEVFWVDNNKFFFQTKADSRTAGYVFELDTNGELRTVVSDLYGLTALPSPDGSKLFISYYNNGSIYTATVDLETGTSVPTPIKTVAEKCVWSTLSSDTIYCGGTNNVARGEFPEDWYMGQVFFADVLWQIDTQSGQATIASYLDGDGVDEPFDVIKSTLSAGDEYLIFINKYNRNPWVLDLTQAIKNDSAEIGEEWSY